MAYKRSKARNTRRKWPYLIGAGGLAVILAVAVLELTHTIHLFQPAKPIPPATGPVTKGEVNPANTSSSAASGGSAGTAAANPDQKAGTTSDSTAPLVAPSGDFVSNHHPNLGGQPAPNSLTSNCTTTPGATCQISFTKGGVTKSLPAKTADAQGSVYWSWTLQNVGLTQGTWSIQAAAANATGTKTASDARDLVVAP